MCSIDKSVSIVSAINIFINEQVDELLVWDEDEAKWVWMLTLADIIRFISHALKCATRNLPISTLLLHRQLSTTSRLARKRKSLNPTSKCYRD